MYLAVITGGIGTGKSTVTERIDQLGGFTISLDDLYHVLLSEDAQMCAELVEAFGRDIADEDGVIIRSRLAARALVDEESTRLLNHITHPRISDALMRTIDRLMDTCLPDPSIHMIAVEIPLMEEGLPISDLIDEVIVVTAPSEIRIGRLIDRGLPLDDIANRLDRQPDDAKWLELADTVFENDGSRTQLNQLVDEWWETRKATGWQSGNES